MSQKIITIEGVGDVTFYKRSNTRNVRIRINGSDVKVTLPTWVPYKAAKLYVEQKADWINQNRKVRHTLGQGSLIGKNHMLYIQRSSSDRFSSKITSSKIIARIPEGLAFDSPEVQKKLESYARKTLTIEAEELILPRIRQLAAHHQFDVNGIEIKNLKSRWGSCDSKHNIAISLFLMQLPWECIDYVIYHELAHTVHMNHSRDFWKLVGSLTPNYKLIRIKMKQYSPHVIISTQA